MVFTIVIVCIRCGYYKSNIYGIRAFLAPSSSSSSFHQCSENGIAEMNGREIEFQAENFLGISRENKK